MQTKWKEIAIIRRSCSDSLLTASQMDDVFGSETSGLSLRSWRIIVSPRGSELLNLSSHLGLGSRRKAAPGAPLSNGGRNGRYTRRSVECICSPSGGRSPTRCGLHYQYLEKITCSPPGGREEIHMAPSHCRIDHVPKIRDGISNACPQRACI